MVGMDDALARVFEPYFSTKTTGTGLGLPIARRNIELSLDPDRCGRVEARRSACAACGGELNANDVPGRTARDNLRCFDAKRGCVSSAT
jgi:hypothetical protein